jgi:hypothetical protein
VKPISIKATLQITILCLLLAGLALPATHVSAMLRSCRTDPILTFSDGSKLTVTATINTDESSITGVVYVVHAPAGLTVKNTVFTGGNLSGKEIVVLLADQQPGVYQTDTLVLSRFSGVAVQAVSSLNQAIFRSASGYTGGHLLVTLFQTSRPTSSDWMTPNTVLVK